MSDWIDLAVDTGGTFTDFVLLTGRQVRLHKVPSRPDNPARAVSRGLADLGCDPARVRLVHGTTVATNALLERKGARLFLVTDAGFEDVLVIGRQNRRSLYNLRVSRPEGLVPPGCVFGLQPDGDGPSLDSYLREILLPLLRRSTPEVVCVCLIGAYQDPERERAVAGFLEAEGIRAVASHDVLPEFREFERFSTTVINAFVAPVMERYIRELDAALGVATLQIMQSNGGTLSARSIGREAIHTLLSGPAGGVVGSRAIAHHLGIEQIMTFDMGGTSTDVCLVPGRIPYTTEADFLGWPARIPIIDIHTVGAGGGSIARLDPGGLLKVGPESAGSDPGPVCYGRGDDLTVTDANVFLGRIPADHFLGGRMQLQAERILPRLQEMEARCGKTPLELAEGIVAIANQHMLRALRVISIQRGFNPADFTLLTFGGAGGLHAAPLARELRIRRVLVPPGAGVLSALGLLMADTVKNYQLPAFLAAAAEDEGIAADRVRPLLAELRAQAETELAREGFSPGDIITTPSVDVRFQGQSWEINLPFQAETVGRDFRQRHEELFGYVPSGRGWEIINVRLQAVGPRPHPDLDRLTALPAGGDGQPLFRRPVFRQGQSLDTPFYQWTNLIPEAPVPGPAVILDNFATVWVPPDFQAVLNRIGGVELCPVS